MGDGNDGMMTTSALFKEAPSVGRPDLTASHTSIPLTHSLSVFLRRCVSLGLLCHLRLKCQVTLPTPLPFRDISAPIGPAASSHFTTWTDADGSLIPAASKLDRERETFQVDFFSGSVKKGRFFNMVVSTSKM